MISVPAITLAEKRPDNHFRRRGGAGSTRFQGRHEIPLQGVDKGAEYINLLLAHPERETSVFELVCGSALNSIGVMANGGLAQEEVEEGFQITSGLPMGDAGVVADKKAVNQYRGRYQELVTEKAEAEENGEHERIEEIEEELAQIAAAITGAVGRGDRLWKIGDKRKNVRDAFRGAVNRAIVQIAKFDKPLAEHLKASIKHGNVAVYQPAVPVIWEVRAVGGGE